MKTPALPDSIPGQKVPPYQGLELTDSKATATVTQLFMLFRAYGGKEMYELLTHAQIKKPIKKPILSAEENKLSPELLFDLALRCLFGVDQPQCAEKALLLLTQALSHPIEAISSNHQLEKLQLEDPNAFQAMCHYLTGLIILQALPKPLSEQQEETAIIAIIKAYELNLADATFYLFIQPRLREAAFKHEALSPELKKASSELLKEAALAGYPAAVVWAAQSSGAMQKEELTPLLESLAAEGFYLAICEQIILQPEPPHSLHLVIEKIHSLCDSLSHYHLLSLLPETESIKHEKVEAWKTVQLLLKKACSNLSDEQFSTYLEFLCHLAIDDKTKLANNALIYFIQYKDLLIKKKKAKPPAAALKPLGKTAFNAWPKHCAAQEDWQKKYTPTGIELTNIPPTHYRGRTASSTSSR